MSCCSDVTPFTYNPQVKLLAYNLLWFQCCCCCCCCFDRASRLPCPGTTHWTSLGQQRTSTATAAAARMAAVAAVQMLLLLLLLLLLAAAGRCSPGSRQRWQLCWSAPTTILRCGGVLALLLWHMKCLVALLLWHVK
jgi:hypothetical protein